MMKDFATIAITYVDGSVGRMFFGTRRDPDTKKNANRISADAAIAAGFVWSEQEEVWLREPTEYNVTRELRHSKPYTEWRVVKDGDPFETADHVWGPAWADNGKQVVVDMPKAREIWRNNLRRMRAPLLAALDVEYQRADEDGNPGKKQEIAAKKQALRDVTADPTIEAAKTPEQLKAAMPAILRT